MLIRNGVLAAITRASHTARTEGIETGYRDSRAWFRAVRASHTARTEGIETRASCPSKTRLSAREPHRPHRGH